MTDKNITDYPKSLKLFNPLAGGRNGKIVGQKCKQNFLNSLNFRVKAMLSHC
jgi:hypothetical protein